MNRMMVAVRPRQDLYLVLFPIVKLKSSPKMSRTNPKLSQNQTSELKGTKKIEIVALYK